MESSIPDPNCGAGEKYNWNAICLLQYIITSFWFQIICFVLKLIAMTVVLSFTILAWINSRREIATLIIGIVSIIACYTINCFMFYYIGVINAKRKQKLKYGFRVFLWINYLVCIGSVIGFGYMLKFFDNDEFNNKSLFLYGIIGGLGVHYFLGVTVFAFIAGVMIQIFRILWYNIEFLSNILTSELYMKQQQSQEFQQSRDHPVQGIETPEYIYPQSFSILPREKLMPDSPKLKPMKCNIKEYNANTEIDICVICENKFVLGEQLASLMCNPNHVFHIQCLKQFQSEPNKDKIECPICKKAFPLNSVHLK